ncbi:hypothetical protein [Legionella birminghamensis]|nr:hypothetical protein [Legionella birminghamensis]
MPEKTQKEMKLTTAVELIDLILKTIDDPALMAKAIDGPKGLWNGTSKIKITDPKLGLYFDSNGNLKEGYGFDSRIDEFLKNLPKDDALSSRDQFVLYGLFFSGPAELFETKMPTDFIASGGSTNSPEFEAWNAMGPVCTVEAPHAIYSELKPVQSIDNLKTQLLAVRQRFINKIGYDDISIAATQNPQLLNNRRNLEEIAEIKENDKPQMLKDLERNLTINGQKLDLEKNSALAGQIATALDISEDEAEKLIKAQSQHIYYAANCFISPQQGAAIHEQLSERGIFVQWNTDSIVWDISKEGDELAQTVIVKNMEFYDDRKTLIHTIDCSLRIDFTFNKEEGVWKRNDLVHFKGDEAAKEFMTQLMTEQAFKINNQPVLKPLVPYQFPKIDTLLGFYRFDRDLFAQRLKGIVPDHAESIMGFLHGMEDELAKKNLTLRDFLENNNPQALPGFLSENPEIKSFLENGEIVISSLIQNQKKLMPSPKEDALVWKYDALQRIPFANEAGLKKYLDVVGKLLTAGEVLDALMTNAKGIEKPENAWKLEKMVGLWKQTYPDYASIPEENIKSILVKLSQFSDFAVSNSPVFEQLITHLVMLDDLQSKEIPSKLGCRVLIAHLMSLVDGLPDKEKNEFTAIYKNTILDHDIAMQEALIAAKIPLKHSLAALAQQYNIFPMHSVNDVLHFEREEENQRAFFTAIADLRMQAESPLVSNADRAIIKNMADNLTMHGMVYFTGESHDKKDLNEFKQTARNLVENAENHLSSTSKSWLGRQIQKLLAWIGNYISFLKPKEEPAQHSVSTVKNTISFLNFKAEVKAVREEGVEAEPEPQAPSPS